MQKMGMSLLAALWLALPAAGFGQTETKAEKAEGKVIEKQVKDEMVQENLEEGLKSFEAGNYLDALVSFKMVLSLDPKNKSAKKFKKECEAKVMAGKLEEKKGPGAEAKPDKNAGDTSEAEGGAKPGDQDKDKGKNKGKDKPAKPDKSAQKERAFVNDAGTITFTVPGGYTYEVRGSEDSFFKDDCRITSGYLPKVLDEKKGREAVLKIFKERFSPLRMIDEKEKALDGKQGMLMHFTANLGGEQEIILAVVPRGRVGYILYGSAPLKKFLACRQDFDAAIGSFSFVDPTLEFDKWNVKETATFQMYTYPESYADKNSDKLSKEFEEAAASIAATLGLSGAAASKLKVYLYPSQAVLKKLTLRDSGFAMTQEGEAHLLWASEKDHQSVGHEVAHILTHRAWGEPSEALFGEGIAVYLDQTKTNLYAVCKKLNQEKRLLPISKLLGDAWFQQDAEVAYKESGAFVKYLIDKFGIKKVEKIYKSKDVKKDFYSISEKSFDDIEMKFLFMF